MHPYITGLIVFYEKPILLSPLHEISDAGGRTACPVYCPGPTPSSYAVGDILPPVEPPCSRLTSPQPEGENELTPTGRLSKLSTISPLYEYGGPRHKQPLRISLNNAYSYSSC